MVSNSLQQELLQVLRGLSDEQVSALIHVAKAMQPTDQGYTYSAKELMQLPREERERLVAESIRASHDQDFETFEAYSEEDFDE